MILKHFLVASFLNFKRLSLAVNGFVRTSFFFLNQLFHLYVKQNQMLPNFCQQGLWHLCLDKNTTSLDPGQETSFSPVMAVEHLGILQF